MSPPIPQPNALSIELCVLDVGTFAQSVKLAPRVEALGYSRYWISEHHGEGAIPNPTLLLPVLAERTTKMRIGTAGVLLRFQSALAVAENFRMLNRLFEGRVNLGLARGFCSPSQTTALYDGRGGDYSAAEHAAKVADVQQILCGRLPSDHRLAKERIDPPLAPSGPPPLWVHSTSAEGAKLAAAIGSHYSFHDHYNREAGPASIRQYVEEFRPSPELAHPSWSVAVAGHCAENEAEARDAQSSLKVAPGRQVIVGTVEHWREQLAYITERYETRRVVVQTLNGKYNLERQVASFARIAVAARSLSAPSCLPNAMGAEA